MSFILRFNKYVLIPTLIEWLDPPEFLRFDSALCNHTDREFFLVMLQDYSAKFQAFIFSTLPSISLSVALFDWITQRLRNFRINNESIVLEVSNVSIKTFRHTLDPAGRARLLSFFSMIKCLEINKCTGINQKYIAEEFLVTCNKVEEVVVIDSEWSHFVDSILSSIATNFSNLRVFNLDGCRHCSESVVVSVVRNCPQLTDIYVKDLEYIKENFLRAVVVHGRRIKKLIATKCVRLTLKPFLMFLLHNAGVSLEAISFPEKGVDNCYLNRVMCDLSLRTMMWYRGGEAFKQLEIAVGWESITVQTVEQLISSCPNMEELRMNTFIPVPDDLILTMFDDWNKFLILNLQGLPCHKYRPMLVQIFVKCLNLREAYVSQCGPMYYNPHGGGQPIDMGTVTIDSCNCSELTILEISGVINSEEYFPILSQSRKLKKLSINPPYYGLTAPAMSDEVAMCVGPYLEQLEEFYYPQCATQDCFESLIRYAPRLKVLLVPAKCHFPLDDRINLKAVSRLSFDSGKPDDLPGEELFYRCPEMTHLKLKQDFGLPYATALVENLPKLKELKARVKIPKTHRIFKINKNLVVSSAK